MTVLLGRAIFQPPRLTYIEETDANLLGVQIQDLELALKEPTQQQKDLGKSDLCGAHRLFRGVAGSGKSIMLALSVAQTLLAFEEERRNLFGKQPARRVLVVCFNKTLVHYLRNKIDDRYGRIAWDGVSENSLSVTHFEGLIRQLERNHSALQTGLAFDNKEKRAKAMCRALDELPAPAKEPLLYDAVYVDESQDLLPAEIELLKRLARLEPDGKQTLIFFYDNAQNIYGVTPPTWGDLGINIVGRTVFLDQCLRNTTETLAFAFNVLVGSFAPAGQHVATRQFADVASLKQRGLISENGDRYDIHFSKRSGPRPVVNVYPYRHAEIDGACETIKTLITKQKVLPSDILVLYKSHFSYKDKLAANLHQALGPQVGVRFVDAGHDNNKNQPLIEDGVLTVSTIASAKGYDAPIVLLLGVDELRSDVQGRASFYVAATRAKYCLYVSGVEQPNDGLLNEVVLTARKLAESTTHPQLHTTKSDSAAATPLAARRPKSAPPKKVCRHCAGTRLHAQRGKFGYFFRCIDCTGNTPIDSTCPKCGEKGKVRKAGLNYYLECEKSQYSKIIHTNVPLDTLQM